MRDAISTLLAVGVAMLYGISLAWLLTAMFIPHDNDANRQQPESSFADDPIR